MYSLGSNGRNALLLSVTQILRGTKRLIFREESQFLAEEEGFEPPLEVLAPKTV
jgi:hypothetical protein